MKIYFKNLRIIKDDLEFHEISEQDFFLEFKNIYTELKRIDTAATEGAAEWNVSLSCYCRKNGIFLQLDETEDEGSVISADDSIFVRRREGKTELIARKSGYPVICEGELSIYEPCRITPDKVHLFYILLPVSCGGEFLKEDFFYALSQPAKDHGIRNYTEDAVLQLIRSGRIHTLTISMGFPADPGRTEALSIKVVKGEMPAKKKDGSIDYYSYSIYREVTEGTVLAEKTAGIEGHPGLDAYGEEIPVASWNPIKFTAGENVILKESEDGLLQYISAIDGVLNLQNAGVAVLPELHVDGDVGPETGSIVFSRNVVIKGGIQPFYKVRCGGFLTVNGLIENGASVECDGDLFAEKGIIGEKTKLFVKGNLETDFISDTKLRVLGDVLIHGTVYASEVFCGGVLTVEGKKMKTKNRGCIVGSKVTSMKEMRIHSAGSGLSKTELTCGIDRELQVKLDALKEILPAIDKEILRMQHGLGIDLSRKDVVENISKLSPEKKIQLKTRLEEIKVHAARKAEISKRVEKMRDRVYSPDPELLSIQVASHLLPDTVVNIGQKTVSVRKDYGPVNISVSGNKIIFTG